MKKNIRKIPPGVAASLKTMPRFVVAGRAKTFKSSDLKSGTLKHLGIALAADGELDLPPDGMIVPPPASGKYSERNVRGYDIIRRDLGLETRYTTVESPNWGDSRYGTHDVDLPYRRYPREFVPPHHNPIVVRAVSTKAGLQEYALVFEVGEVLDQQARDFDDRLLECLNLLQENIGTCGVQKSGASGRDYIATLAVSWEFFPPGSKEEALARLFRGRKPAKEQVDIASERYDYLMRLRPQQIVIGTSGFQRYIGAMLRPDLVVFENLAYGNAIYVMFGNWAELSKKDRLSLLAGRHGDDFERVIHSRGWKGMLESIVDARLKAGGTKR
jgi:hypothetical protein